MKSGPLLILLSTILYTLGFHADALAKEIQIKATPLPHFKQSEPGTTKFGKLEFIGGLVLESKNRNFGGISGFRFIDNSSDFIAVTDKGRYLTGTLIRENNVPISIKNARLERLSGANGKKLKGKKQGDSEGIALSGNKAFVSFERNHRVETYKLTKKRNLKPAGKLPISFKKFDLPNNHGLEAIAVAPADGPLSGSIIVFAERFMGADNQLNGFLIRDGTLNLFTIEEKDGFSVTDAMFLPNSDLIILERRYSFFTGLAMRIRRFSSHDVLKDHAGAGQTLINADGYHNIDNMEGLAVTQNDKGQTILTLVSDDNFSGDQRTLLLEFRLID